MSSSDTDLNIPDLGPAQRDPELAARQPAAARGETATVPTTQNPPPLITPPPPPRRGFGLFTGGLLMLVLAACGGLGYWMMELQQQFQARTVELTEARYQLGELQELLKSAENSALESGRSLITQVGELNETAQAQYKAFDAELARLKTTVEQRNRLEIAAQKKAVSAQETQLAELMTLAQAQKTLLDQQAKALKTQQTRMAAAEKQLKAMAAQGENVEQAVKFVTALKISQEKLSRDQNSRSEATDAALEKLRRELTVSRSEASTETAIINEQLSEQSASIQRLQASLKQSPEVDPALQRRIALNEDAIQAFDGTRRQLNRELLQIRQKLNNLQLSVESR